MTTLNVPTISRKKAVESKSSFNSFRVLGDDGVARSSLYSRPPDFPPHSIVTFDKTLKLPSWHYNSHYEPERNVRNRDKCSVNYLRRNVRTLNNPVNYVPSKENTEHWWPSRVPCMDKPQPVSTRDSTMRADFNWGSDHDFCGSNRHKQNLAKPAQGIVPINWLAEKDGNQRFYQEKISYEHQYDSRWQRNYPIRNRRQGAFVDDPISPEKANLLLSRTEGWRVDTNIQPIKDGGAFSHLQEVTTGILPGLTETCRRTDQKNIKCRSHFDIAPRSNLNVRIREYLPNVATSGLAKTESPQQKTITDNKENSNSLVEVQANDNCNDIS